jgi:hypothetical protein
MARRRRGNPVLGALAIALLAVIYYWYIAVPVCIILFCVFYSANAKSKQRTATSEIMKSQNNPLIVNKPSKSGYKQLGSKSKGEPRSRETATPPVKTTRKPYDLSY